MSIKFNKINDICLICCSFQRKQNSICSKNLSRSWTSYYNVFSLKLNMRADVYCLFKLKVVADNKIMLCVGKT